MKPLLILFIATVYSGIIKEAFAQTYPITNGDFEDWYVISNTNGVMDPVDWRSFNQWTIKTNIAAVSRSTDAFHGQYALQITPLRSNNITDTLTCGIMNGNPIVDSVNLTFSWAGSGCQNPKQKIYGYYKYVPDSNFADSAYMEIFTSGPGNLYGSYAFNASNNYTLFEVSAYGFSDPTQTLGLVFYYRSNDTSSAPKGKLLIDFLSTSKPNGMVESFVKERVHVYPNPVQQHMQILIPENMRQQEVFLQLMTIEGKEIKAGFQLLRHESDKLLFERKGLPAGIYFARLIATDGAQLCFRITLE